VCSLEFPDLEHQVWLPLKDKGVTVLGVNAGGLYGDDTAAIIGAFIKQTGVTFPVVMDQHQSANYQAGVAISPFPFDVVVDGDGIIRALLTEYDPGALLDAIEAAR
jgi:hypothetical protein